MKKATISPVEASGKPAAMTSGLKVADEVWIAAALLHREQPDRSDFSIEEIVHRAGQESLTGRLRPGVYVHVVQHCVANRPPNRARYRMLYETASGRRRLFRPPDAYHPGREGGKMAPNAEEMPQNYRSFLDWYREWCSAAAGAAATEDPLLALFGSGKKLWADEPADDYMRRLREGWQ
ncbi:MAG TPA: hypothetical protein VGS20_09290 [Candidatus Acidoferrales bacterium]|nr:hypothetical protein [Candidatus Acidoferrales bacterium]